MLTRSRAKKCRLALEGILASSPVYDPTPTKRRRCLVTPLHLLLSTWRRKAAKARAASRMARAWRRYLRRRPSNEQDPFTLEPIEGATPEDGGVWFDIVMHQGKVHRYSANSLFTYLILTKDVVEPLQRHALNEIELSRLDRAVDQATRRHHGYRRAIELVRDYTAHSRSREQHRSELAFFFEDDIRSILNSFFALVCSTQVTLSTEAPRETTSEEAPPMPPPLTLTLAFGGQLMNETLSRLGSSQGAPLPVPEVPAFESLELRVMLRNNLRHRWEIERIVAQLHDVLRHLYRCAPTRATEVFHGYITPSATEISDRMAAFDAQLAMEFGLELADLRHVLFEPTFATGSPVMPTFAPASPSPAELV